MEIWDLLKDKKTVVVQRPGNVPFQIKPECWEGIVLGYSLLSKSGKRIPGYYRKMFINRQEFGWMTGGLDVVSYHDTEE